LEERVGYEFEWDRAKAESNLRKHGVRFDEATTVFGDPLALLMTDPAHSLSEQRYLLLGMSNRRRLLVVSFAERGPTYPTDLSEAGDSKRAEKI
jgi:hypothetical protein